MPTRPLPNNPSLEHLRKDAKRLRSAVLAGAFPAFGIGFTGVSLAFGLTVVTGAYAFGPISGGHFNPAVSVGLGPAVVFPSACCCRTSSRKSSARSLPPA